MPFEALAAVLVGNSRIVTFLPEANWAEDALIPVTRYIPFDHSSAFAKTFPTTAVTLGIPEDHETRKSSRFAPDDVTAIRCPELGFEDGPAQMEIPCCPDVGTVTCWDRKLPADVEAVSRHAPVPPFGSGFAEDRVSPAVIVQFAVPKFAESLMAFVRAGPTKSTGSVRGLAPALELLETHASRALLALAVVSVP